MGNDIDDIDRSIIAGLFENARRARTEEMAEDAGVAHSTISKRIQRLEEKGIIQGYRPIIDYERAGFPFEVLLTCTAPIADRDQYIQEAMQLRHVIHVRELMLGCKNVHITVVGRDDEDITQIAKEIDAIGFEVNGEILIRSDEMKLPCIAADSRS